MGAVTLNAYSYSGIITGGSSKLYVPVKPQNLIYSHFDHVAGVAAKPNQGGVSISKIQILNSLLNQLITMKGKPKLDVKTEQIDDKQLDALIQTRRRRFRQMFRLRRRQDTDLQERSRRQGRFSRLMSEKQRNPDEIAFIVILNLFQNLSKKFGIDAR